MDLPPRVQQIIDTLYSMHRDLANGTDDDRRALTRMIAEQACFELGPQWGCKATTPTNPQGQSQIAFNGPEGLVGWRWQDNDGSVTHIKNAPIPNPPMQSLAGQFFIQVDPIDHLHVPPAPIPAPAPAGATLDDVLAAVQRLEAAFMIQQQALRDAAAVLRNLHLVGTLHGGWPLGTVAIDLVPVIQKPPS